MDVFHRIYLPTRKEFSFVFCVTCSTMRLGCRCSQGSPLLPKVGISFLNERSETFVNHKYFDTGQEKHFLASLKYTP